MTFSDCAKMEARVDALFDLGLSYSHLQMFQGVQPLDVMTRAGNTLRYMERCLEFPPFRDALWFTSAALAQMPLSRETGCGLEELRADIRDAVRLRGSENLSEAADALMQGVASYVLNRLDPVSHSRGDSTGLFRLAAAGLALATAAALQQGDTVYSGVIK